MFFTIMDIYEPCCVALCIPLMVLKFIYCSKVPTVLISHCSSRYIDSEIIFISGLFLGVRFPVEVRDFLFTKSVQAGRGDDITCCGEYQVSYRG